MLPILAIAIHIPWPIYLLAIVIALVALTRTPWFKGALGEFIVNLGSGLFLDKNTYHLFKNITLPTGNGTTQIDHIVVSRYGVFVVETKNMSGAIYGGEKQPQWTQAFGRNKYKFQSPLHQNYKHTRTLRMARRGRNTGSEFWGPRAIPGAGGS